MSEEQRLLRRCRYWLWVIALMHIVCLLLRHAPERQIATTAPTHYASIASQPANPGC